MRMNEWQLSRDAPQARAFFTSLSNIAIGWLRQATTRTRSSQTRSARALVELPLPLPDRSKRSARHALRLLPLLIHGLRLHMRRSCP